MHFHTNEQDCLPMPQCRCTWTSWKSQRKTPLHLLPSFSIPSIPLCNCHKILSCPLICLSIQVLQLTEYSQGQIFPALDHFRVKFHQFFMNDFIHSQTNQLCYWIKFRSKLFVFLLNLPCMKLLAIPKFSRDLGRVSNLNKLIN